MKLNIKNTFFVGLIFLSISMFWQVYDSIVSKILAGTFGLDNAVRGIIMALDNIVALFMLPLFGMLSDKSQKCRFGRRTPYIVVGTILSALTFVAVGIGADSGSLALFMTALCFTLVFMSVYRSPAVALMPDVTVKPLRSKANAVINLMGALGGLISLGLIAFMVKENGKYLPLFAVVSALMILFLVLFLVLVKEKKLAALREEDERRFGIVDEGDENEGTEKLGREKLRSMIFLLASVFLWFMAYNAVTSSFSVYAQEIWGIADGSFSLPLMVAQVAAIAMFIPVGFIASRIGRKKTILIGVAVMFFSFFAAFFVGSNLFGVKIDLSEGSVFSNPMFYVMSIFFALCGVGWATINVNSYPMVVEMSKGSTVGKFTGYYYTASMAGQIVTPFLSGLLMDAVGMESLFMYSAAFMLFAFVTMFFVFHGDSKPLPKKSALENYDTD